MSRRVVILAAASLALCAAHACGPASRRDLSELPQRQITFDDMCRLQTYFDHRNDSSARPFRIVDEELNEAVRVDTERDGRPRQVSVGQGTYLVTDAAARRRLRRMVNEEYDRMPELPMSSTDTPVRVHVHFWSAGPIRRLRPDMPIEIGVGQEIASIPFNPCIGEFLFGAEAYAIRRQFLRHESERARGLLPTPERPLADPPAANDAASTEPDASTP